MDGTSVHRAVDVIYASVINGLGGKMATTFEYKQKMIRSVAFLHLPADPLAPSSPSPKSPHNSVEA